MAQRSGGRETSEHKTFEISIEETIQNLRWTYTGDYFRQRTGPAQEEKLECTTHLKKHRELSMNLET